MKTFEYPNLSGATIIALDVETKDPNLKDKGPGGARNDGYLLGVSIAVDGYSAYYPLRHEIGDNCDVKNTILYLKDTFSTRVPKVGANIIYDLEWLRTEGIHVQGPKYDIQIAEWLLDEEKFKYSLESLCQKYLGKSKTEHKLEEAAERMGIRKSAIKENLWKMSVDDVEEYAIADSVDALAIWKLQEPLLEVDELSNVFYNVETPLIDVLLDMRFKGVKIDVDKAVQARDRMKKEEVQSIIQLSRITGREVDVWAANDIEKACIGLGLPVPRTEKDNPSFNADFLTGRDEEFFKLVAKIRSLNRSGSVFIESKILNMEKNGRLYPTFRQSKSDDGGTKSGRFASSNPNVQQIPSRDAEIGPLIRSLFVAEQGKQFLKCDYKQQEPRVTVHYANVTGLRGAREAVERYNVNPETDYHQMVADMANISRNVAKTMNLGLAYGMGKKKMAEALDVPMDEAERIYNQYHDSVPFIKALTDKCTSLAESRGYIKTIAGRRKRFNLWGPKKWTKGIVPKSKQEAMIEFGYPITRYFTYRSMNALIQGSSADMVKLAMIDVHNAGYVPTLTVHDELCFSDIENEKQVKEINDMMVNSLEVHGMPISVPLLVDCYLGDNWSNGKVIKV